MSESGEFNLQPARREKITALIGIIGQAKSGKTYSALLLARGLAGPKGRIAVIDTEGKRASIYAGDPIIGPFETVDFRPPFSSLRYYDALQSVMDQGPDVIIIDSMSHEHEGEGGFLEFSDQEERRLGDKRNAKIVKWTKPRADHNRMMNLVRRARCHVIMTIREKRTITDKGEKVELPVCNHDLPYEMTLLVRLQPETHQGDWRTVPMPLVPHVKSGDMITVEHGARLAGALSDGAEPDHALETALSYAEQIARDKGRAALDTYAKQLPADVQARFRPHYARLRDLALASQTEPPA